MECRDCNEEARERFKTKKLFLTHWLETSNMKTDWAEGECHSLHGLIENTEENGYHVPESWPTVTVHDKDSWQIYRCDEKVRNRRGVSHKEKSPKWNKLQSREQSLAEINKQWLDDNSNFVVWEKMPMHGNHRDKNAAMRLRERPQSVPPENRVFHSRSFNQQQLALQKVSDMYKSKDDLEKRPPSCFPIQCCATSKTDFYSLASANEENHRARSFLNQNIDHNDYPTVNDYASSKDTALMPNVVPSVERISSEVPPHSDLHQTRRHSKSHSCQEVMPDLLRSMDRPRLSHSRATSRAGSVSQLLQYPVTRSTTQVYRPLYIPSALHRASASKTPSSIHKVPAQSLTPFLHKPKPGGFSHALKSDLHFPTTIPTRFRAYTGNLMHNSFHFPEPMDNNDTYSVTGTTFTVYNIEPSGMHQTGYDSEWHTNMSQHQNTALRTGSTTARYHTGKSQRSNIQARCLLKFGKKANHNTKQPGYFSCPRKVDTLPSGEYIVLDTENQTLQVFSAKGLCDKVYQFKINILDMRVWSTTCVALLYQNQVGLFDFEIFQLQEIVLSDILNPRTMDKMKHKQTGEKLFVIGTMSKVIVCDIQGKATVTIGNGDRHQENTLFKRVNAVTVDRRNNDIYILDSEYRTIFAFSHLGEFKTKLDTTLCDLGPVFNPLGMCMSREGHLLIADTFNHRILHASQQGLHSLIQYSLDYYPNHVKVTSDGRLLVAINSEGRTFAGVRVYDYRNMTMMF